jgi:outer membrane beta-barrel protein
MKRIIGSVVVALTVVFLASPAFAQRRHNPLEGQPAIRHRLELRSLRFEVTPFAGFTMLNDFNNTAFGGVKLEYHLTDWIGIGGLFGGGAAVGTGLKDQIEQTLFDSGDLKGGPSKTCADAAMNHVAYFAAGQVELSPFGGKFAVFSKAFMNYDFYIDLGVGMVGLANNLGAHNECPSDQYGGMNNDVNNGLKIGPTGAVGMHWFFNKFVALDLSYRAIVIKDNPSGRDTNGDKVVNSDDLKFGPKNFITLGLAFYLPADAEISH